jgi:hypothetical protein
MLIEAAETGLGYFGFDRTAFGAVKKRNRKWWSALREETKRYRE